MPETISRATTSAINYVAVFKSSALDCWSVNRERMEPDAFGGTPKAAVETTAIPNPNYLL
jgi:hypothetical protein